MCKNLYITKKPSAPASFAGVLGLEISKTRAKASILTLPTGIQILFNASHNNFILPCNFFFYAF